MTGLFAQGLHHSMERGIELSTALITAGAQIARTSDGAVRWWGNCAALAAHVMDDHCHAILDRSINVFEERHDLPALRNVFACVVQCAGHRTPHLADLLPTAVSGQQVDIDAVQALAHWLQTGRSQEARLAVTGIAHRLLFDNARYVAEA